MAHEVEKMFYTGEVPWHGLGGPIEEAEKELSWTVHTEPLFRGVHEPDMPPEMFAYDRVEAQCVVRDSDGKILSHHVGPEWTPYQNHDGFNYFRRWQEEGLVSLETAGSLRGGSIVWILGRMNKDPMDIGKGDTVLKYILLTWGHGSMAVRNGFSPVRVVCMNTLGAAIADADSALIRVSHTKNVVQNVEALRDVMDLANARFEATAEQYRLLAAKEISGRDLQKYVRVILDRPEDEEKLTPSGAKIINLFEGEGKGSNLDSARGTWWGAYNAAAEFLTWQKGKDRSNRLESLWLGSGKAFNKNALDIAVRMAA